MRHREAVRTVRNVCFALAVAVAAMVVAPLSAHAHEAHPTLVTTTVDASDILWVEAHVQDTDADVVKINFRAPSKNGGRQLWQRCRLNYSGPGIYRCGVDVGPGSPARAHRGTWLTGVSIDGAHSGHAYFSMAS